MEIEDYEEQPPGKPIIAIFTAYLPAARLRIRKLKLIKLKTGHLKIGYPSYTREAGPYGEKKEYIPYIEWTQEKSKEFEQKILEALKPFMR